MKNMSIRKSISNHISSSLNREHGLVMRRPDLAKGEENASGYAHMAFSLGSRQEVDEMTSRFEKEGYQVAGKPRVTGDGYYESVILDPDGNIVELTV